MKAIIIEDEDNNIEVLKARLSYIKDVEIIGVAKDVKPGIELIERLKPDLVFLDIKLPSGDAFQLLDALKSIHFEIIITTAHDDFTIQAIHHNACDYLKKPFDVVQLRAAIERAKDRRWQSYHNNQGSSHGKIVLSTIQDHTRITDIISVNDIVFLESAQRFTIFWLKDNRQLTPTGNLGKFIEKLNYPFFLQVHRQFLVNLNHVKKFEDAQQSGIIHFDSISETVDVGMTYKSNFSKWLKGLE